MFKLRSLSLRLASVAALLALPLLAAPIARAQDSSSTPPAGAATAPPQASSNAPLVRNKLAAAAPVTYDNRYELYGGINLMTFQAGQNLPKRMNLGGVELLGTYWLTPRVGLGAEFRGEAGTTPVLSNPYTNRPLVVLYSGLFGAQFRGPRGQRAALNYHAYGGIAHGDFTQTPLPANYSVGLYSNSNSPLVALGASVDFNRSKNLAIRLSPDLMIEHFGTETREFFAISGGVIYRFGHR